MSAAKCLRRLWGIARDRYKIDVQYSNVIPMVGVYLPDDSSSDVRGIIYLHRDPLPQPRDAPDLVTQPLRDACRLAHEFGHHLRHRQNPERPPTRGDFLKDLAEEELVWKYGERVLRVFGFKDWPEFEVEREEGLKLQRKWAATGDVERC